MTTKQAIRLIQITRDRTDEMFNELIAELTQNPEAVTSGLAHDQPKRAPSARGTSERPTAWSLPDRAMSGSWEEKSRSSGESYRWPDGVVEPYAEVVRYVGAGEFVGMELGLGFDGRGNVAGFVFGPGGGSMRGITYFFAADDFTESKETISMIRGGGPAGRGGFGPSEPVPPAYADFKTDTLRNRCAGKWNRLGVVAGIDDAETMLHHTAFQVRMRGLA